MIFLLNEYSPGQVAEKILGPFATPHQVDLLTEKLGLNRPVLVRYQEWLFKILQGDLGHSTLWNVDVNDLIWERLFNTAIIATIAFIIIVTISIVFGVLSGMREGTSLDRSITVFSLVATSVPEFASGVFLQSIFVVWLAVLPGTSPLSSSGGWSLTSQIVLPVAVMVLYDFGYVTRMVRTSVAETMARPFIRTALLKGLPFHQVVLKHAIRNAMIGPFTVIMLQINYLLTGVVVVEAVFGFPGFGRMMLDAALNKDVAVIEAGAMFAVFVTVITQVFSDIGYILLNPRIRLS